MSDKFLRPLEALVLVGALATIPLTVLGAEHPGMVWVQTADWVIWAVFSLEYLILLAASSARAEYIKRNPLNLAVIVLSYPHLPVAFGLVRLARFMRFVRFLRLMGVTARGIKALRTIFWRRGLVGVTMITCLIIFGGGAGLALLEPQTVRGGLEDGIWWAIVTASTVGYGDIAPTTGWGRAIAVLLMLCGIGFISTLAASITTYFVGQEENVALRELNERMMRVEGLLTRVLSEGTSPDTERSDDGQHAGVQPRAAQTASNNARGEAR